MVYVHTQKFYHLHRGISMISDALRPLILRAPGSPARLRYIHQTFIYDCPQLC
jgi:hypothetical protein